MAWWTRPIFEGNPEVHRRNRREETLFSLGGFRWALKGYFRKNYIDFLYLGLSLFTYLYLGLSIVTFFFEQSVPNFFPKIIDALSEPYLGTLGIYVVVKEIERRRGRLKQRSIGELFAIIWFIFFIVATFLTLYSNHYHLNSVYKTVVTNALAALIIRIGMIVR